MNDWKSFVGIIAGIVYVSGFIPYLYAIVAKGAKPVKGTWLTWFVVDAMVLSAMSDQDSANWQITFATIGAGVVFLLSLHYGTPGWSTLEKICMAVATAGMSAWLLADEVTISILISSTVLAVAAIPTIRSAWTAPEREDKIAWSLYFASCLLTILSLEWTWSVEEWAQPISFTVVETIMIAILFLRPRWLRKQEEP